MDGKREKEDHPSRGNDVSNRVKKAWGGEGDGKGTAVAAV